ncbi:MAG TPA: PEP-CTERM sorting domain-containing protein [Phycisphaerae bacterium]|nr:PEP-CTERM sorting domain-containing protein [Phycisphaerales bacterium]HRX85414.1 PEP-CTERM sorting domain-containing protein [Phycisphaerae bacterium]
MKKVLGILAVGMIATAANAATIGLRWSDTTANLHEGPGTVEVYMQLLGGESIGGVVFNWGASDLNLTITDQGTNLNGWGEAGDLAGGTVQGAQFSAGANPGFNLQGPAGDVVIGYSAIGITGLLDGSTKEITAAIPQNAVGVVDGSGAALTWDARYNTTSPGYIAFGDYGNPGWGTKTAMGHQPTANPLLITKTPEPTSLALVALGGFALLRRRR